MTWVLLALIGTIAGLAGGLLGVGGSTIMIPALDAMFGANQHRYQAAAMIVNFFVALPAMTAHYRAGALLGNHNARLIPMGLVAVIIGVWMSEWRIFHGTGEAWLRLFFGMFITVVGCFELYRWWRNRANVPTRLIEDAPPPVPSWKAAAAIAIPTGIIAGLLGVGGGVVAVPLQRILLRYPMRTAIANSSAVMVTTSFVGSIFKNAAYMNTNQGSTDALYLAILLSPAAIVGGYIGGRATHILPVRMLKIAMSLLLLYGGFRLISGALQTTPL